MSRTHETREDPPLEIDEDLRSARHAWRFERAGWAVMAALFLLATVGAFGNGLLATASAASGGARLEYERIERHHSPARLRLTIPASLLAGDSVRVWVSRDWIDGVDVDEVTPEPRGVALAPDRVIYTFDVAVRGDSAMVELQVEPDAEGRRGGRIGIEGGPTIAFRQFVLP